MDFQELINSLETSPEVLDKENISIYVSSFKENKSNKDFLLSLLSDKKNNIPYLRNIYTIIIGIYDEKKDIDLSDIQKYLYEELENDNLKVGTKIIFTNLLIKISNSNYLKEIIEIYDKQINDNSISIGSIENFTDFFCEYEKGEKFVDCFLYFRKNWIRFGFNDGIKGFNNRQQGILELTKDKYIYFLQELGNKRSLKEYVWHLKNDKYENNFTQKIIDKGFTLLLEKELYDFLISLIKYGNEGKNNYYKEKVYYKQIQDFFNRFRVKYGEKNFFIKFFDDISYDKKGFYYFRFFEEFIANVLENKIDIKLLLDVESVKADNYIFAYRIYSYLKDSGKDELLNEFENNIGNILKQIELNQEEGKRKNDEYLKKDDNKKYEEIKSFLKRINRDDKKWFLPILFKYYLENEDLLLSFEADGYNINKIINQQLDYFLTWENLNPGNIDALEGFVKTNTGYNGFTGYFDESLGLVLKVSEKLGKDLSSYKDRLVYYIPFQYGDEKLNQLLNLCGLNEFNIILEVYKNYPIIADFHPQNIITYYEKVKNELSEENNREVLKFLKSGIEKYKSFYDKEKVLDFLNDFGESNKYFQDIFEKNKLDINYFNYGNKANDEYQNFRLSLKSNEILIKNGDNESIKWRLEQIKGGKIENREYKDGFVPDDEINFGDDDFIKILKHIKSDSNGIIDLFIDLLNYGFEQYSDNYTNYCFYIFKSFNYYLSGLSNLSNNKYLVNKIGEILSKIEKIDSIIYFKRYIDEFENGLFLERIEKEILKIENSSYKNKDDEIDNKNEKIKELGILIGKYHKGNNILENKNKKLEIELSKYKEKELFFKDIVLIVEGKTDKKIIEYVYETILGRDELPFFIFNSEGTNNIESIVNIFNNENYKKIIILYDFDSSGFLKWNGTQRKYYDSSINTCLKKKCDNDKIYDLLLPLPLGNEKLGGQVIKDYNIYQEGIKFNSSNIESLHYGQYSLIDLELLFFGIHEKIDNKFFIENNNFPNKPITYKGYRKSNSGKNNFLDELLKFYREEKIDLEIELEELFKNIKIITDEIDDIIK